MKRNIIVFGATGPLGTYLVDHLEDSNKYNVYACGYRNVNKNYYKNKNVECRTIDIRNSAEFGQLPSKNVHSVVQLSGVMPARMIGYDPRLYLDVNIYGTYNILEYCRKNNVGKYIFSQSHSDVAGHWNTGQLISPNAQRNLNLSGDHAMYIISKNGAVDMAEHYYQDYGIMNVILRLPTVYSYRPVNKMYVNGIPKNVAYRYLIEQAREGKPLEIWGDPTIKKDIVYVKDFVQLVEKALDAPKAKGFYNVGTSIGTSLEEQICGIADIFNDESHKSSIIYRPEKPSQISYLYDIENARRELGYEPEFSYLDMLRDM